MPGKWNSRNLLNLLRLLVLLLPWLIIIRYIIYPFCAIELSSLSSSGWEPYMIKVEDVRDGKVYLGEDDALIPAIYHQTWKNEQVPEVWSVPHRSCREKLSNFTLMFWTDEKSRNFIAQHYKWFLPTYDSYPYAIQRADVVRYFILYHYGGFYVDLDIGCRRSFDNLRKYPFILVKTTPLGFSNDMMASSPKHPFLEQVITNLAASNINLLFNYPTVFFSTGPMFINLQYGRYLYEERKRNWAHPGNTNLRRQVSILPGELYGGSNPESMVGHFPGSSWHASDAKVIFFIWDNGSRIFSLVAVLFVAFAAVYFAVRTKRLSSLARKMSSLLPLHRGKAK